MSSRGEPEPDDSAELAARPVPWPVFSGRLDSGGEWEPSEQWVLAVGPAIKLLLHTAEPWVSPGSVRAVLASPTVESLADILRAHEHGEHSDEFETRWHQLFEGKPDLHTMAHWLLQDAADQVSFPSAACSTTTAWMILS
jgi:hypothetical protein